MFNRGSNVFVSYLKSAKVKHTNAFANKIYNEHPNKNNLLGISQMLNLYNIDNIGITVWKREDDLNNIETPFIAYVGDEFVVVDEVKEDKISYISNGENLKIPLSKFWNLWTGVTLICYIDEKSIEPSYYKHYKTNVIQHSLLSILFISLFLMACFLTSERFTINTNNTLLLLSNSTGIILSVLLLSKQLKINSAYVNKICTIIKEGNCNDILESKSAKILNVSWSEIGFGYFLSNIIIILYSKDLVQYISIYNLFCLPYTIWSIWYQKYRAHKWCVLCVNVQIQMWILFIINLSFNNFNSFRRINFENLLFTILVYIVAVLSTHIFIKVLNESRKVTPLIQELNSIKASSEVFNILLSNQTYYQDTSSVFSKLTFGNIKSTNIITIFSNPHCHPCAKIHQAVNDNLKDLMNNILIQYIFTSFNESLEISNRFLIYVYMYFDIDFCAKIYNDWFKGGEAHFFLNNSNSEKKYEEWLIDEMELYNYSKSYKFDLYSPEISKEIEKHKKWIKEAKPQGTPTVIINGYRLPKYFKIEDLKYHL